MASKKIPTYKSLPFEVHFERMSITSYEFLYEISRSGQLSDSFMAIEMAQGDARDVTFRCDDPSGGALAYVVSGRLDEYIPPWLELVDEGSADLSASESFLYTIKHGELILGGEVESDGYEHSGEGLTFYCAYGEAPDYLVLDAEGSRVVVDRNGFLMAEDGSRIGRKPIVSFTEDEVEGTEVTGTDEQDIRVQLAELAGRVQ